MPKRGRHHVYVLRSLSAPDAAYVGYSVDVRRRRRQHNGELVGGAKRTKRDRPWRIAAVVSGFASATDALSFEWAMHKPSESKTVRAVRRSLVGQRVQPFCGTTWRHKVRLARRLVDHLNAASSHLSVRVRDEPPDDVDKPRPLRAPSVEAPRSAAPCSPAANADDEDTEDDNTVPSSP